MIESARILTFGERRRKAVRAPELTFSLVNGPTDVTPMAVHADWAYCKDIMRRPRLANITLDQYQAMTKAQKRDAKKGPGFVFAKFNGKREDAGLEAVYGITGDIDNEGDRSLSADDIAAKLDGYAFAVHSTFSHRPEHQRLRFLVPFSRPATPDEARRAFDYWQSKFEGALDQSKRPPSHLFYLPACPKDAVGQFIFIEQAGKPFNPDTLPARKSKDRDPATQLRTRSEAYACDTTDFGRVREALSRIPSDDREIWLKCGMALHSTGDPQARPLWDEWSASSYKFDARDQQKTWESFSKERREGKAVMLGTIFHLAIEHGWEASRPHGLVIIVRHSPMNWAELAKQRAPARQDFLRNWLSPVPTLLAGGGGTGKTQLAQCLSTALVTGCEYIERPEEPRRVLMWACEDDRDELWRRQERICEHFDIDMAQLAGRFFLESRVGLDNLLFSATGNGVAKFTALAQELEANIHDQGVSVVFLDSVAQLFGANENDRHLVTRFVNGLAGLARDRAIAFVLLAHPARSVGSEFSGSGAWENAVRMRWYLGRTLPDDEDKQAGRLDEAVRFLARRKANYSSRDWRRFHFQNGVLVPEQIRREDGETAAAREAVQAERVIVTGFLRLQGMGLHPTDAPNSPNSLAKLVRDKDMAEGLSLKALRSAIDALMVRGFFRRGEIGRGANRHKREGLIWLGAPMRPEDLT